MRNDTIADPPERSARPRRSNDGVAVAVAVAEEEAEEEEAEEEEEERVLDAAAEAGVQLSTVNSAKSAKATALLVLATTEGNTTSAVTNLLGRGKHRRRAYARTQACMKNRVRVKGRKEKRTSHTETKELGGKGFGTLTSGRCGMPLLDLDAW